MSKNKRVDELFELIISLGWDYDRFSIGGQEIYDKIIKLITNNYTHVPKVKKSSKDKR